MGTSVDWTFGGLWPYEPKWFDTPDGVLHYIDEGPPDGVPVVLLHGNPTWGFLYRNFISALVGAGHRAIVPDCLGFGRSDKPPGRRNYTLYRHVARTDALLESLDLERAVVVPHDWGGPIGLSWAAAHPERIAGLFILNTAAHAPRGPAPIPFALRVFRAPGVGEVLVKGLSMFHRAFLFRVGVVHRERLVPSVRRAYLAPHPTWTSRTGVLEFPRAIPAGPGGPLDRFASDLEAALKSRLGAVPVQIVWGLRDPGFPPSVIDELWLDTFPHAAVLRIDDAGHFLQEDAHEQIVPQLIEFASRIASS